MAAEVHHSSEQSVSSLLTGIVGDVQDLLKQQLQLTRKEIEADVAKATRAAALFCTGAGIFLLGAIVFCLSLSHLVHWLNSPPATDPASFPLWACHGVVSLALFVIGGLVIAAGRGQIQRINPTESPAAKALEDNVKWMTNSK